MKKTKDKNTKLIESLRVAVRAIRIACQIDDIAWTQAENLLATLESRKPFEPDLPLTSAQLKKMYAFVDLFNK